MSLPHRISAGALVFRGDAILMVRYADGQGGSFLVGPGGALEERETVVAAAVRETWEETGVVVRPLHVAIIEDLLGRRYKMSKTWLVCEVVAGEVTRTAGAVKEGILEAGWYTREQLERETVFPSPLKEVDWERLRSAGGPVLCLESRDLLFE